MKQIDYLVKEIPKIEGNLLGIGINHPKILKKIEENNNITICNLLDDVQKGEKNTSKKGKSKKIELKKLKKIFKYKRVNYVIVNEDTIKNKTKTFISDSIYITKDYIFYLTDNKDKIISKYARYKTEIKEIKCTDGYILIINTKEAKNNKLKDFCYQMIDALEDIVDIITNLIIN